MVSYDEAAVSMFLEGDSAGITNLAVKAAARVEARVECPECGDEGPHDDNGRVGSELSYCCSVCGTCFDAEEAS